MENFILSLASLSFIIAFFFKTGIKKSYQIEKLIQDGLHGRVVSSLYIWSIGSLINQFFGNQQRKYRRIRVK